MEAFLKYLYSVRKAVQNIMNLDKVHIVIGNESCDIDSSVSSLVLAYLLHISKTCPIPKNATIIPVQNVDKDKFIYRSDNCYLYKEVDIPLDVLVYRNEIDFEALLKANKLTTTLVDHHVLPENNKLLESSVIQIFDHRPRDPAFIWDENKIEVTIKDVGSCSTLLAERIFYLADHILFYELAFLIYATIVYDTQALSVKSGRAKELDHFVVDTLESRFNFNDDRKTLFDKLWAAHNDVSHLTPKQILLKDLKIIEQIPLPGLPMLAEDFLKIEDSYNAINTFANDLKVSNIVLIGLDASNGVKRDLAIFSNPDDGIQFRDKLLNLLFNSQKYGYDFEFTEVPTNLENVICLRQGNVKWSRKQIVPIIKDLVNTINH